MKKTVRKTGSRRRATKQVGLFSFLPAIHDAIWYQTIAIERLGDLMANNFDRLTAAADRIATEIEAVAAAIRNPAVDNNDQPVIDDLAGRLEGAADALAGLAAEEAAEDAGPTQPTEEPELPEEPVEGEDELPVDGQ